MMVYTSVDDIELTNTAIAIGVFDGVHRGHQEVLHRAAIAATGLTNGTALTFTFDVHPAEVVAPSHAPMYISSLSQRIEMISRYSPHGSILVLPFDHHFAELSAQEFVQSILVDRLGARLIFVGADFRYGKGRQGGVMDLEAAGDRFGFVVQVIHSVAEKGQRVSSTRIRALIADGEIRAAQELLGHLFAIRGEVVHGKKLGRTIGYPTANILPEQNRQLLPVAGVYAGYVHLPTNQNKFDVWRAAISIGVNPTTDVDKTVTKVEAYLMDGFSGDLYGLTVDVELAELIRVERKFDNLDALVEQIGNDVAVANEILVRYPN